MGSKGVWNNVQEAVPVTVTLAPSLALGAGVEIITPATRNLALGLGVVAMIVPPV
jgi:hypothetical protein